MPRVSPRRTQQERRETTRAALLDATIDCLVEHGYADTTTTRVVERAGVSRGAQVHHFPTKADLVSEAVRRLAQRRIALIRSKIDSLPAPGPARLGATFDLLWQTHSGPLFAAALELWTAARTDPELRAAMIPVEREVIGLIREVTAEALDPDADPKAIAATVTTTVTLILGLGMQIELLSSKRAAASAWADAREVLLDVAERQTADSAERRAARPK